jgi:uncharacterized protein (TIRG00374 family)
MIEAERGAVSLAPDGPGGPVRPESPVAAPVPDDLAAPVAAVVPDDLTAPVTAPVAADEPEDRAASLTRRLFNVKTGLSFLLGVVILITLLRATSIRPGDILAELRQIDPRFYALAILSYVLTFPFRGLRWQRLLKNTGTHLPMAPLTEVIFISWFVNSVLPGKVGDVYRGYLVRREFGHSLSRTVGTVVAERVVDLICLIVLLGITGIFVLRNRVSPMVDHMLQAGWVGLAALVIGMALLYWFGERLVQRFPAKVQAGYAKFAHGTFASFNGVRGLPLLILLTALCWTFEAGRLYFVMQSLHVGLGLLAALFTVAAISLALIIPTPGGLGGVEAAFTVVLAVFGVPLQLALAVALLDRLISYYSLIILGVPAFLFTKRGR